ncbi:hypothetical protein RIR_jg27956.t1 [Rhizophagus irregularis DAOM 181602=DAOM 197198]|nr:hypothetical protein RIR_jg27956.t1 [Rhizophagus irregularis DAOM 181602=DAOM 197198]
MCFIYNIQYRLFHIFAKLNEYYKYMQIITHGHEKLNDCLFEVYFSVTYKLKGALVWGCQKSDHNRFIPVRISYTDVRSLEGSVFHILICLDFEFLVDFRGCELGYSKMSPKNKGDIRCTHKQRCPWNSREQSNGNNYKDKHLVGLRKNKNKSKSSSHILKSKPIK